MNILIATTSFPDKNNDDIAGKFVMHEARAYALNGINVTVLTPHQPGAVRREMIQPRLQVIRFRYFLPERLQCLKTPNKPMYGQRSLLAVIQLPVFLTVFLLQVLKYGLRADVIHCQWTASALLALPCKWLFKKNIVMTVRGSDIRLLPEVINKFIHTQVDAVIDCYGDSIRNNENKKKYPAHYIKLPLIVDDPVSTLPEMPRDMWTPIKTESDVFKVVYLGRFNQVKIDNGLPILELIDAADIINRECDNRFHIFYIGGGDAAIIAKMQHRINALDLKHCITFLGPKNNVNDYLAYCDLGIGGIAFNAVSQEFACLKKAQLMYAGNHNLDTPWKDKVNTLFFRARDVRGLADAMIYAMADRKRLEKIGMEAHRMMSRYVKNLKDGGAEYGQAFFKIIKKGKDE
jgi:glycosyltransferase involved in cell wall biosynthesis